jgi:hypothetical protein
MSAALDTVAIMTTKDLFLRADASLREVIDSITPQQLGLPVPASWSSNPVTDLRGIIGLHARDEAWVPDVLAGRTIEEVGDAWKGDLLGADPIASYDHLNDLATAAVKAVVDLDAVAHLSYGDYPVSVYFEHTSYYRGFQASSIARHIGLDWSMPDELVEGLWDSVAPQAQLLREWHVIGAEVPVPEGSSREVQLLGLTGFYEG